MAPTRNARGQTLARDRDGPAAAIPAPTLARISAAIRASANSVVPSGPLLGTTRCKPRQCSFLAQFSQGWTASNVSDGRKTGAFNPGPRLAQCRPPNDPRHGLVPRHCDAPASLGQWPSMQPDCPQARTSTPNKAPCGAGKQQNQSHETGVVSPVSLAIPAVLTARGMDRNTKQTESTPQEQGKGISI